MRFVYYFPPFIVNIRTGLLYFVPARRLAAAQSSAVSSAGTISCIAIAYAVTSILLGFFQNKKNAVPLILAGQGLLIISFIGLILFSGLNTQYLWLLFSGAGFVMFFAPYQVIVKMFEKEEAGLAATVKSSAIYTFSWSSGLAAGPFIAAWVWGLFDPEKGWKICYLICILLSLCVIVLTLFIYSYVRNRIKEEESLSGASAGQQKLSGESGESGESGAGGEGGGIRDENGKLLPDLVIAGWVVGTIGYVTVTILRSLLPYHGEAIHLSTAQQGVLIAMISLTQALTALSFAKSRKWMYHPLPMTIAALCGIAGLLMTVFSRSMSVLFFAMILYGIFSGTFVWNMIYHALANTKKVAKYVAVNETIVGVTGVASPLLGGLLSVPGKSYLPFAGCAVLLIAAIVFHVALTWKSRKV